MLSRGQRRRLRRRLAKAGHLANDIGKEVHLAREIKKLHIGQTLGSGVGALAGPSGAMLGGKIGTAIENRVSKAIDKKLSGSGNYMMGRGNYMIGRGDYILGDGTHMKQNSTIVGGGGKHKQPNLAVTNRNDESGEICVRRREYVTSVNSTGSTAFTVLSFAINPGLRSVFQWLSQVAANYTEYAMVQCVFTYESVISPMSVSSVGSLGNVCLAANYNSGAPNFSSFGQMVEYSGAVNGKASDTIQCGIECDPHQNSNDSDLYIRGGAVPSNQDIKTYDLAKLQIGLFGIPTEYTDGTQLGLLWCDYQVILRKPRLYSALGNAILFDTFYSGGTLALNNPLGDAPMKHSGNALGGRVETFATTGGATQYIFPDDFSGTVSVALIMIGTSLDTTSSDLSIVTGSQITQVSNYVYISGNEPTDAAIYYSASGTADQGRSCIVRSYSVTPALTGGGNALSLKWTTGERHVGGLFITMINPTGLSPVLNGVSAV